MNFYLCTFKIANKLETASSTGKYKIISIVQVNKNWDIDITRLENICKLLVKVNVRICE